MRDISAELNVPIADLFALYMKPRTSVGTCRVRMSEPIALVWTTTMSKVFAATDAIAHRVRKLRGATLE
ncbi:MAG: hypothetical protein QOI12_1683 [Alphaproteobacteria bacterium]|nr:hypothetical protein [Alphaproteobacteria bacterium]